MMRPAFCLIAFLLPGQAQATNTLCTFQATEASRFHSIEILGPRESTMIQINHPASEHRRRLGRYVFRDFSYEDVRIDLVHTGLHTPDAVPSFTLKGRKDHVVFDIDGRRIIGKMKCQWEWDAELPPPQKRQAAPIPPLSRPR